MGSYGACDVLGFFAGTTDTMLSASHVKAPKNAEIPLHQNGFLPECIVMIFHGFTARC